MPVQASRPRIAPLSAAESLSNRASALYLANVTDDALSLAFEAVSLERTAITLNNLVVILESHGRFDEAFPYAQEAYALGYGDRRLARLYGESLLRRGDLTTGWPLYSAAYDDYPWLESRVPKWRGESLVDRRLLVFTQGGYGDNIYFLRWLGWLRDSGVDITLLAPPTLCPLARTIGITCVENWNGNFTLDLTSFDYHAGISAVPQYLNVTFDSPSLVPYLHVTPRPRFHLRRRVGFCWRAGETPSPRRSRTLNWEQRQRITSRIPRHVDLSDLTGSWLDTAQFIASLDLVVTVDTGVCHLAAALGIPTWVILPGASSWHYPIHTDAHPFYPTLRMFRNGVEGLDLAVDAVREAL